MSIIQKSLSAASDHKFECRVTGATLLDYMDRVAIRFKVQSIDGIPVRENYLCQVLISLEEAAACKIPVDLISHKKYNPHVLINQFGLEVSGQRSAKGMHVTIIAEGFEDCPKQISQRLFVHEAVNFKKIEVPQEKKLLSFSPIYFSSLSKKASQLELSF